MAVAEGKWVQDGGLKRVIRLGEAGEVQVDAGARVPQNVEVVTHWNFSGALPSALPVTRLGFDCRQIMRRCIEVIDMQRRGETPPEATRLSAVFEEEMTAADSNTAEQLGANSAS